MSIILSQIQPHFLYNSLIAIRQLCDIDPPKAKQAVTLFSRYLRGNTESLTTARYIPRDHQDLQYMRWI
ncbi:MAG: histidine kinase [Bilophila wadsworthia]|uniref:histidine kinase n=1 Tax=Bilophila wadsworthia TaxID=35833 RepID=UPI0009DD1B2A